MSFDRTEFVNTAGELVGTLIQVHDMLIAEKPHGVRVGIYRSRAEAIEALDMPSDARVKPRVATPSPSAPDKRRRHS